jgi:NRPS condensation-like uncharacterized protein
LVCYDLYLSEECKEKRVKHPIPAEREDRNERVPLGLIDKLSMVHEVLLPSLGENVFIHLEGLLNAEVLAEAFLALFRQFPICRARIVSRGWKYSFDISHMQGTPGRDDVWSYRDLRSEPDPSAALRELERGFANEPLKIMDGPQMRALLVRLSEDEHRFCLKMSHTVFDAISAMLLFNALVDSYTQMLVDPTYAPPQGTLQRRDLRRLLRKIPPEVYTGWIKERVKTRRASSPASGQPATPYAMQDITGYNPMGPHAQMGFEVLRLGEEEIAIIRKAATSLNAKLIEVCMCCILRAFHRDNDRKGIRHGVYKVAIPIDLRPLADMHMEPGNLSSSILLEIPAQEFSSLPRLLSFFRNTLEEKKRQGQAILSLARYGLLAPFTRGVLWWYRNRESPTDRLFLDTMPLTYSGQLHKYLPPLGDAEITDILGTFQLVPVLALFKHHISFTFPFIDDGRLPIDEIHAFFEDIRDEIQRLEPSE